MATLKQVRKRISSVKNTMQITKAMKMVAAAKLRKAQDNILAARPYADKMEEMVRNLAARAGEELEHPLFKRREIKKAHVISFTGDRGLCGAFNSNLIRQCSTVCDGLAENEIEVTMTSIGRKGLEFFKKRNMPVDKHYMNMGGEEDFAVCKTICRDIIGSYIDGTYDQVTLVYSEFHSAAVQRPREQVLLPIATGAEGEEDGGESLIEFIYEPSAPELLDELLPKFIEAQLYKAALDNLASEFGARMTAMENATRNAEDMIDSLTLQYNRARQEAITRELMDIVGGAEALVS